MTPTSNNGKNIICIYHGNCFDGMAAAWVVKQVFPHAVFIPAVYGDKELIDNITQDCHENANINDSYIIVDFSFPRALMELLHSKARTLIVIDHHKTAQADCEGLDYCKFDMNESGASLAWKTFFPNTKVPNYIKYVKDRDLWQFKEPNSRQVNSYIQSYDMTLENSQILFQELTHSIGVQMATEMGMSIERYKAARVNDICKSAKLINGIPTVNTNVLFSEVPVRLMEIYPDVPYAQYYWDNLTLGIRVWGLRSRGEVDVSAIAAQFGGGGHHNAAGYQESVHYKMCRAHPNYINYLISLGVTGTMDLGNGSCSCR